MKPHINIEVTGDTNNCKITNQHGEPITGVTEAVIHPLLPNTLVTATLTIEGVGLNCYEITRTKDQKHGGFWQGAFVLFFILTVAGTLLK